MLVVFSFASGLFLFNYACGPRVPEMGLENVQETIASPDGSLLKASFHIKKFHHPNREPGYQMIQKANGRGANNPMSLSVRAWCAM